MSPRRSVAYLTLSILAVAPASRAGTIRVPDDQPTIQAGIDAATVGDTVLVAPATYTGPGNKEINFAGRNLVLLGELGPEMTIIDCEGSPGANARGFIFENGESSEAIVSGFTVSNASMSGSTFPAGYGAGMFINSAGTNPTIENCIFERNHAEGSGGGLACGNNASPRIENCDFRDNTDGFGAGAYTSASTSFVGCSFVRNSATDGGGAIDCFSAGTPTFTDCTMSDNSATFGGAIYCAFVTATFNNCLIERNSSTSSAGGGGIYCAAGSTLLITDSVLKENTSETGSPSGGGVHCVEGSITLTGCTLYANSCPSGSGVFATDGGTATIQNTIIAFGLLGEAVGCDGTSTATLTCSDLFGNQGGDWVGCVSAQQGADGNISEDPLFCNPGLEDLQLAKSSPCAPAQSGGCGLIGALDVSCVSSVEPSTWGAIKAGFGR
jgi:predicted outer membrane repeat protein